MLTGSWVVLLSISWNNEGWSNSSTGEMMRSQPCTLSLRPSSTSQPLFSQWQTVVSILPSYHSAYKQLHTKLNRKQNNM